MAQQPSLTKNQWSCGANTSYSTSHMLQHQKLLTRNSGILVKSSNIITKQYIRNKFNFSQIVEAMHFEMNREESLTNLLVVDLYSSEQGLDNTSSANYLDKLPEHHRLLRIAQLFVDEANQFTSWIMSFDIVYTAFSFAKTTHQRDERRPHGVRGRWPTTYDLSAVNAYQNK